MGNFTNEENWAARERLRYIERALWWRGWLSRKEMLELFGISAAQASSDLQRYAELSPGAMVYNTSLKRYESTAQMECLFHTPELGEGLALAFGEGEPGGHTGGISGEGSRVAQVELPARTASPKVERYAVIAAERGMVLRVTYLSLSSGKQARRNLLPRAFGWDGRRWHLRAWCLKNEDWRDFVLSRMSRPSWPEEFAEPPEEDTAWENWEVVRLRLNPKLSKVQKASLKQDYGLKGNHLELSVRQAMRPYLLAEMFLLDESGVEMPRHFVLDEGRGKSRSKKPS